MSEELQATDEPPPLAWNEEGQPFVPEKSATYWRVRRFTGKPGRPPAVWTSKGILHLPLQATIDDLRIGVNNQPDSYRLYPVDAQGRELSPVAHIELVAEDQASPVHRAPQMLTTAHNGTLPMVPIQSQPDGMPSEIAGRFFDLYERTLTSRDAHDAVLANLLTALVTNTAQIQQSTAKLLGAATTTIKIANGVQALERQEPAPPLDIEELTARLAETIPPPKSGNAIPAWILQLISSPVGTAAGQMIAGFGQVIVQHLVAKAAQHPVHAGMAPNAAKPAAHQSAPPPATARRPPPTPATQAEHSDDLAAQDDYDESSEPENDEYQDEYQAADIEEDELVASNDYDGDESLTAESPPEAADDAKSTDTAAGMPEPPQLGQPGPTSLVATQASHAASGSAPSAIRAPEKRHRGKRKGKRRRRRK